MKKVTAKDYINALETLEYIKKQEKEYEKIYQLPPHTTQIFETILTKLTKSNITLKQIIKNNIRFFLKDYNHNPKLNELYKEKIILLTYRFYNNLKDSYNLELDPESQTIINKNENLSILLDDIKTIVIQIYKNNIEINNLNELIQKRKISLIIKDKYHKQTKTKRKKHKKRLLQK